MEKQTSKDDKSSVALLTAKEQWNAIAKDVLPFAGPKSEVHWVKPKKVHGKFFLFFGVVLPLVAMTLELWTHTLARYYFDPFPSGYHVLLFTLIPLSNLMAYLSGRMDLTRHYATMALFSGMAMGIGVLYTLMFLSITPTMCLAILACGIGLLGLAPLLSLPCTWFAGKTVCAFAHKQRAYFDAHQVEHIGHLIVLVMVIAVELPSTLTRVNIAEAAESHKSAEAIGWLRKYGNQEVMLRACYERSGRATDVLGTLYEHAHPVSVEQARQVFYQVTGKAFNSVPIPASARSTIQKTGMVSDIAGVNATVQDEFDLDADIAGEAVSGIARGLAVKASTLSGTIDNDGAIAKLEWTVSLQNSSRYDREARAKLFLPPGAVVTGAKIRINDQEREANIMSRGVAREIYTQNIIQKKDPLLVSMSGVDRVLIQCFPVRPSSSAEVKLSIVAPLQVLLSGKASLELPTFEERNFVVDGPTVLNLESTQPITCSAASKSPESRKRANLFIGTIDSAQLSRFNGILNADRNTDVHRTWCHDSFTGNAYVAERLLEPSKFPLAQTYYVVIDGSEAMEPYRQQIIDGLMSIKRDVKVHLQLVADETRVLCSATSATDPIFGRAVGTLSSTKFQGGQNDEHAVKDALEEALKTEGAVLWIHGCQPMPSVVAPVAKQLLQSANHKPLLYDMQVATGPNEILSDIEASDSLVRVAHTGNVALDLSTFFNESLIESASLPEEYRHHLGNAPDEPGYELRNSDLAQLRAYHQLLKDTQNGMQDSSTQLAMQYHLVSPVSSAIVNVPLVNTNALIEPPPPPTKDSNPFESRDVLRALGGVGSAISYVVTGQMFSNAVSSAFSSTISQLNNLSAAAGPSYGSAGSAGSPGSPGSDGGYVSHGGGGGNPFVFGSSSDDFARNNQVILRESVVPPTSRVGQSFGNAYSSQGDTGLGNSNGIKYVDETPPPIPYMQPKLEYNSPQSSKPQLPTQQYNPSQSPMLQGATNGTVSSGGSATVVDAREGISAQELVQEQAKKLSSIKEDAPADLSKATETKWDVRNNYFRRNPVAKQKAREYVSDKDASGMEQERSQSWGGKSIRMEGTPFNASDLHQAQSNEVGQQSNHKNQFFSFPLFSDNSRDANVFNSDYESSSIESRSHGFLDGTSVAIKLPLLLAFAVFYPFVLIFVKNRTKGSYKPDRERS